MAQRFQPGIAGSPLRRRRRERDGLGQAVLFHVSDEAPGIRARRVELGPEEDDLFGPRGADEIHQAADPAGGGDETQAELGEGEARTPAGHAEIAGQGQLESAPHRGAVHRDDDRFGEGGQAIEGAAALQLERTSRGAARQLGESAPAQKDGPLPVTITAPTASSRESAESAPSSWASMATVYALAFSGRSRVKSATAPDGPRLSTRINPWPIAPTLRVSLALDVKNFARLVSVATATPPDRYSQPELLALFGMDDRRVRGLQANLDRHWKKL